MFEHVGMIIMDKEEFDKAIEENAKKQIKDLQRENKLLQRRNELLRKALTQMMTKTSNECNDVRISKIDFLEIYNDALNEMFDNPKKEENNDIYGYDITVHWHGIYCNCGDGATAYNHIITAIESVYEEDDEECIED